MPINKDLYILDLQLFMDTCCSFPLVVLLTQENIESMLKFQVSSSCCLLVHDFLTLQLAGVGGKSWIL